MGDGIKGKGFESVEGLEKYLSPTSERTSERRIVHKGRLWAVGQQILKKVERLIHAFKSLVNSGNFEWVNNANVMSKINKNLDILTKDFTAIKMDAKNSVPEKETVQLDLELIHEMKEVCEFLSDTVSARDEKDTLYKLQKALFDCENLFKKVPLLEEPVAKPKSEPEKELSPKVELSPKNRSGIKKSIQQEFSHLIEKVLDDENFQVKGEHNFHGSQEALRKENLQVRSELQNIHSTLTESDYRELGPKQIKTDLEKAVGLIERGYVSKENVGNIPEDIASKLRSINTQMARLGISMAEPKEITGSMLSEAERRAITSEIKAIVSLASKDSKFVAPEGAWLAKLGIMKGGQKKFEDVKKIDIRSSSDGQFYILMNRALDEVREGFAKKGTVPEEIENQLKAVKLQLEPLHKKMEVVVEQNYLLCKEIVEEGVRQFESNVRNEYDRYAIAGHRPLKSLEGMVANSYNELHNLESAIMKDSNMRWYAQFFPRESTNLHEGRVDVYKLLETNDEKLEAQFNKYLAGVVSAYSGMGCRLPKKILANMTVALWGKSQTQAYMLVEKEAVANEVNTGAMNLQIIRDRKNAVAKQLSQLIDRVLEDKRFVKEGDGILESQNRELRGLKGVRYESYSINEMVGMWNDARGLINSGYERMGVSVPPDVAISMSDISDTVDSVRRYRAHFN